MKNQNKELSKTYLFTALSILGVGSAVIIVSNAPSYEFNSFIQYVVLNLLALFFSLFLFAFGGFFIIKLVLKLDLKSIDTRISLLANKISEKTRVKNTNVIYPNLLAFFYEVLEKNNETLNLPLGNDYSALIPCGYKPIFRNGSMFYIFQIVTPEKPDTEDNVLCQLMRTFVSSELINYGIAGLSSYFSSKVYGNVPSVYVDRVYYNARQKMLNIAVQYICTEEDCNYFAKAVERDNKTPEIEGEVYDDEL